MDIDLNKEIERYRKEGANVLVPSLIFGGLSEFHTAVIETIQLSPNPNDGDVYPDQQKKNHFRLKKQALVKLANCAGISWHPYETKRIDNRTDRNYVAYQAVGGIRKPDGSSVAYKAEYDMDFEVIEEEQRELFSKKAESFEDKSVEQRQKYIEDSVRREMLAKRKHRLKNCEAGAMNRVIRALLGLKGAYSIDELRKPFVTARIIVRPDFSDKNVRQQMMAAAVRAMIGIYGDAPMSGGGGQNGGQAMLPFMDDNVIDLPAIDDEDCYIPHGDHAEHFTEPPAPANHEPTPPAAADAQSYSSQEIDFSNCDKEEQENILKTLIARKGYDTSKFPKPMEQFNDTNRISLFRKLMSMPDTATGTDVGF